MIKGLVVFTILFFLSSCNNNDVPKGILKPKKMQVVLWDVMRADAFTKNYIAKDSSKNLEEENAKLQQKIFTLNKISKEEFYKSYDYYKVHTDLLKNLLDSMTAKANVERYDHYKRTDTTIKVEQ
jgi:hypothetical protein